MKELKTSLYYYKYKMRKYTFKPYSPKFKELFNKEKSKLKKILPKNTKIEHVGSTAVPDLGGKGIIDIVIKTPRKKLNKFINKLEELGYESKLKEHPANDKRIFLKKIIRFGGKERYIHIHLTFDNDFWNTFIVVRDYLRQDKTMRKKYAEIKKKAVKFANGDGKKYRKYKNNFLNKLTKKALKMK